MKNNFKKWIPFIIFLFLCMLIYSKHGMIEVKALTTTDLDREHSYFAYTLYNENHQHKYFLNDSSFISKINDKFYVFSTKIYFNNESSYTRGNLYLTYHFKYYYDITDTDNFHFKDDIYGNSSYHFSTSHADIYEEKLYTSIDDKGKYSYDYFITLNFTPTNMCVLNPNCQNDYFYIYSYTKNMNTSKVGDFSIELINAMYTNEGATYPFSIEDYINNQSIDYQDPLYQPFQEEVDNSILGYIKRIWNKIVAIGSGILAFPERIFNFIKDKIALGLPSWVSPWFDNIRDAIIDALTYLFIPDSTFIDTKYQTIKTLFEQKFSLLFVPFNALTELYNRFDNLSSINATNFIINIPEFTIPGYDIPLINSTSYDLNNVLSNNTIHTIWILYLDFLDVFLIISFLNLSWNKLNSIIGAQIVETEIFTVTDNSVYDGETGDYLFGRVNKSSSVTKSRRRRI